MIGSTLAILIALLTQLGLGLAVFLANQHRKFNQAFLLLSLAAAAWLASLYYILTATSLPAAQIGIREASSAGILIIAMLNLLRLSIGRANSDWRSILGQSRVWLIVTAAIIVLCQTKFFLQGVRMSRVGSQPTPVPIYGQGVYIYVSYFVGAIALLGVTTWRDLRRATGGERTEIAFILIGGIAAVVVSLPLSLLLGGFFRPSQLSWFAPFRVVFFSIVVAYGIATRRMMEVGVLLRRFISCGLLGTYLLALYALVWWLVATALRSSVPNAHTVAHVADAVVIAFAMAPACGISQRLAERLFIGSHQLDFRATVSKAAKILASVTTLRDLLDRFANTVAEAVATDRVFILLADKQGFLQRYPLVEPGSRYCLELTRDQATITELESNREPIVLDQLPPARPTPQLQRVMRQCDSLQIALAMGIFTRDQLAGVLLLGARKSGRIYGATEQGALQVLCGQLAVAIENAELFTEVQNAKIYNETLLENLTSGVIAAGTDDRITVFNNEAGQITGLNPQELLDGSLGALPPELAEPLIATLRTGQRQEDCEIVLNVGRSDAIIRASTSIFHGQNREVLGALMVLTDITAIKRLELQIRRSDRLASLGTLSAGIAHEIKNPLVSLKTFEHLLPERYQH